jgi:hypothetical protein
MSNRKELVENMLTNQKNACAAAVGGTSKSAKNTRKRISSVETVEIPEELLLQPAPREVVKEVIKNVEVPGPIKEVIKEVPTVNYQVLIGAMLAAGFVGAVVSAIFF